MSGLFLGYSDSDTIAATQDAPVGSNCLVICDGINGQPSIGTWTVEMAQRAFGRIIAILRTTARVRDGNVLTIPGATAIAAVAIAPSDGAIVTVWPDGTRIIQLADWTRTIS